MAAEESRIRRLAAAAVLAPAALYLAWAGTYFGRFGYPAPAVQDEFSYLLAGDTFAQGRLANPAPAFPEFFETIHVLVEPAYVSIYPPAQGLWLALGQTVFGHPWWGVVLSTAMFVLATGWAALGWMGPGWAFGAGVTALSYGIGTYWSTSYWGGSVAALGGAIVLGAAGRLRRRWQEAGSGGALPRWGLAGVWSLGCTLAVLARPYEGGVLAVLTAGYLARRLAGSPLRPDEKKREWLGCLAAAAVPAAAGCLFLMAVNQAATGSPWRLAYLEHARQYQIRRTFYWQKDRPVPAYRHEMIGAAYEALLRKHLSAGEKWAEMGRMFRDHYGSVKFNTAGLLAALAWGGASGVRWVAGMALAGLAVVSLIVWVHPHYYAPYASFLAISAAGGAAAAQRRWGGRWQAWLAVAIFAGLLLPRFALLLGRGEYSPAFAKRRAEIVRELEALPGRHLVFVKYSRTSSWQQEWVYNGADLDNARILWVRWHGSGRLEEFLTHYGGRKVWFVEADLPGSPLRPGLPDGAGRSSGAGQNR